MPTIAFYLSNSEKRKVPLPFLAKRAFKLYSQAINHPHLINLTAYDPKVANLFLHYIGEGEFPPELMGEHLETRCQLHKLCQQYGDQLSQKLSLVALLQGINRYNCFSAADLGMKVRNAQVLRWTVRLMTNVCTGMSVDKENRIDSMLYRYVVDAAKKTLFELEMEEFES